MHDYWECILSWLLTRQVWFMPHPYYENKEECPHPSISGSLQLQVSVACIVKSHGKCSQEVNRCLGKIKEYQMFFLLSIIIVSQEAKYIRPIAVKFLVRLNRWLSLILISFSRVFCYIRNTARYWIARRGQFCPKYRWEAISYKVIISSNLPIGSLLNTAKTDSLWEEFS